MSGSTNLNKKRENDSLDYQEIKKIFLTDELNFGAQWSNEYTEGDSIFCEIDIDDENESKNQCKSSKNDIDNNNYDEIQCTQRFINDLNENSLLNHIANYENDYKIFGSQYTTRADVQNRTIINKSHSEFLSNSILLNFKDEEILFNDPFHGLPDNLKKLIFKYKGITELYEWQKECLTLPAIANRKNLLYALPTSGGKTLVAEILMLREIICREKNVLFILPYVSIVQEKVASMAPFALNFNFMVEEYAGGKGRCPPVKSRKRRSLYIASIEKGALLLDSLIENQRVNEIGLIVVDELHLIGEKGRGATLESLLTKAMFLQAGIQIIGMSATIGNLPELSDFLDADIYTRGFRPVELREYIKCGKDILEVNAQEKSIDHIFKYHRTVDFKYSDSGLKIDPDHIAGLVSEIIPDESCLIFCPTRKNCENVAILLSKTLPKKKYLEHKKQEKLQLMDAFEKLCGTISTVLRQTIPLGIAYHHSGLTTDERKLLENAYHLNIITVICCTSTLAAGVNLPAKRVIIRSPYIGSKFITLCQYKQMIGRAGRAGMKLNTGESILICSSKDNYNVGQMLFSPMDNIISSLDYQNSIGLQSLILSIIGLNLTNCLRDILKLISHTLLSVQSNNLNISINTLVISIIKNMFKHKILKISNINDKIKNNHDEIITTQEITDLHNNEESSSTPTTSATSSKYLILGKSTKFELTKIGKAAFKAGIDYIKAQNIYNELKLSQKTLVLSNYSHLLYLVVGFNLNNDLIIPNSSILLRCYNQTDDDTRLVAKIIGITEIHLIKMTKTLSIKGNAETQLNRLFRVMILNDVIKLLPIHEIAIKYEVDRGIIQSLITQSISSANCITRLCEEIEEFWCFKALFEKITYKLDHCCIPELAPLLDLPSVKINRARQLYNAGFRTIEDIAKTTSKNLVSTIEHMPHRTAKQIISAAKIILIKKLEDLQEETEAIMNCLQNN